MDLPTIVRSQRRRQRRRQGTSKADIKEFRDNFHPLDRSQDNGTLGVDNNDENSLTFSKFYN